MIMENKITVKEFVDSLDEQFSIQDTIKDNIISRKYVPFAEKVSAARAGIHRYNLTDDNVITDTPMTYLCYVATVLRLYTNLDISADSTDRDYDMLQESGVLTTLFECIGDDLEEFQTIFDMCKEDFHANYLSAPGFIQRQVNKALSICEKGVVNLISWLDDLDTDSLNEIIKEQIKK